MSINRKHLAALLGLLLMVHALGCASQYHRYSNRCGVNCRYCEPGPLPYRHSPGCTCHSKPGARYLSARPVKMSRIDSGSADTVTTEKRESPSATERPESQIEIRRTLDISQRPYDD